MNDWKSKLLQLKKNMQLADSQHDSHAHLTSEVNSESKSNHDEKLSSTPSSISKAHLNTANQTNSASNRPLTTQYNNASKSKPISESQGARTKSNKSVSAQSHSSKKLKYNKFLLPPLPPKAAVQKIERSKPPPVPEGFRQNKCEKLTRQSSYKQPDPWVAAGIETQLSSSPTGRDIDIVIGLDFGTSYTKAAVGLMDTIYPVSWHGIAKQLNNYLLPSEYSVLPDGCCNVGQAPNVDSQQVYRQLKHPFICSNVPVSSIVEASVFVALVLRYVRAWVYKHHAQKIGKNRIRWILNLGAPSNGLELERLEAVYRQLACLAWDLSVLEQVQFDLARTKANIRFGSSLPNDLFSLDVVPEFIAQIAGYVQSANRKPGLHALVDVGGGTLDIVTFIIHQSNEEDVFPFLVPEVKTLGTHMLYQNRLVGVNNFDEQLLPDNLSPVLGSLEFASVCGLEPDHVSERDNQFWHSVKASVRSVMHRTKRNRYRLSDAWTKGLPTFLTGGGCCIDEYNDSVKTAAQEYADRVNLMQLPLHPRLTDTYKEGSNSYQRISVACGLAMDSFSLGKIIPAKDVEDDICVVPVSSRKADQDELYPK